MRAFLLLLLVVAPRDEAAEAVKKAIEKTAEGTYSYKVKGRYERTGEFKPRTILTCRIKTYQSARHREDVLIFGPEGLWKSPADRLGEKTQNADPEAADIVETLRDAEAPHKMLLDLLPILEEGRAQDDLTLEGTLCSVYQFKISADPLRKELEKRLNKSLEAKATPKPDEVKWATLKGTVRVFAHKKDGVLVKIHDKRSVQIFFKDSGSGQSKTYTNDFEIEFSAHGKATLNLPKEVKETLKIEE